VSRLARQDGPGSAGIRVGIILVILLLLRVRVLKGHATTTNDPWLQGIGLVIFILGLALAIWARVYLGRNWGMPMSQKVDPELVTTGPYRSVRHPIYSGIILAMIRTTIAAGDDGRDSCAKDQGAGDDTDRETRSGSAARSRSAVTGSVCELRIAGRAPARGCPSGPGGDDGGAGWLAPGPWCGGVGYGAGSWRRSSPGGDPYRMSISRSAAAASRIARRSAASGVRYRLRWPAS
jgi:Isoprenylcysteine carboxyl methyltransferase (ICMT) family